jgi:hypothetical protein
MTNDIIILKKSPPGLYIEGKLAVPSVFKKWLMHLHISETNKMTNYIDDINNQFNTDANLKSLQAKSLSQYDVSLLYSKKKKE